MMRVKGWLEMTKFYMFAQFSNCRGTTTTETVLLCVWVDATSQLRLRQSAESRPAESRQKSAPSRKESRDSIQVTGNTVLSSIAS